TVGFTPLSGSEKLLFREVFTSVQDSGSLSRYIRTYIFDRWNDETKQLFYSNYGDLPYLFDIKVDEQLFRALAQYWNPAYSYFTFGKVDLVPTLEEYTTLLRCPRFQVDKKGECKFILWKNLRDLILAHSDEKKKVDVFALSIYGLVISPRALGLVDEASFLEGGQDLLPSFLQKLSPVEGDSSHAKKGRHIRENYMAILQNLQEEDVEWRAPWLIPDRILYRCGSFDWVPLLGIWEAIGYAHLLVLRQYSSRQFVPATLGLAQCEFLYRGDNYKKKIKEVSQAWNQARRMKRLAVGSMTTPKYSEWRNKRINEQLEEKKIHLRLDAVVQKLEAEKLKKGNNKAEDDLDSLKTNYKKLRLSMRTAGLGKTS
ncbi:hypothetical protein Golax_023428, partial [Gossypium laxum]|nr:hypothetical protein [Gossypium laxum]